jgi:hypothetical protein
MVTPLASPGRSGAVDRREQAEVPAVQAVQCFEVDVRWALVTSVQDILGACWPA